MPERRNDPHETVVDGGWLRLLEIVGPAIVLFGSVFGADRRRT